MLNSLLASPVWPRLFASLAVLLVARSARVVTRRKDVRPITAASALLVVRDLTAIVWGEVNPAVLPALRVAGETGAYLLFLFWTGRFRISNRSYVVASVGAAVAWLAVGFDAVGGTGFFTRLTLYLLPPVLFLVAQVAILRVDRFVFSRGYEIEDLKPVLQVALVVQGVLYLVVPLRTPVFESTVAVLPSVPFAMTALFLISLALREERVRVRTLRENAHAIFDFLSGVGQSLGGGRDPETILDAAIGTMTEATEADAAAAILVESGTPRVTAVVGLYPPPVPIPDILTTKQGALRQFVLSMEVGTDTPIWGRVLATGEAVHIAEAAEDPVLAAHAADRVLRLRSVLVLPLKVRGRVLGLVSVARRGDSRPFSSAEFDHARTMANFVAVTLDNYFSYRLQRDVEIAGEIQRRLQAPPVREVGGIRYAGVSRPARGVSGDYYDVIPLDDERTAVVMCDVSGKGVPAALVMVMVRTIAHLALSQTDDAGDVLRMINAGVSGAVELDRFATASVVVFDARRRRCSYANAAHHPALLVSSTDGTVTPVDADGLPIGIEMTGEYPSREIEFPEGSTMVFFTDGVIEAFNPEGQEFGDRRLAEVVGEICAERDEAVSSEDVLSEVMSRVDAFVAGAPQHDDMTMLVCSFPADADVDSGDVTLTVAE